MKQKSILFLVAVCSFAGSVEAWGQTDEEIAQASVEHPLDMSSRIVNPSFDGGDVTTGWEGTAFKTVGGKALAQHTGCFYKTYQTLTNLPKGVYAVGVKAFYRPGSVSEAYSRYQIQEETLHMAMLYAATKSGFNCDAGVFPVVRRKGDKSVYRVEKRQRRKPFAFYDIARLPPRRIEAGVVVCLCLEIVWVVVVAVRDDERLGAV